MIAEKFQSLVGARPVTSAGQRGNVRQRLIEQHRILEAITDPLFEADGAATPALDRFGRGRRSPGR